MTEPQVWTLIGVFTTIVIGMLTVVSNSFVRVMRAEFRRLDEKVDGLRVVMDARFSSVERSLDGLDRDVDGLTRRMLGEET